MFSDIGPVVYVEVVLCETGSPSCKSPGSIHHVKDTLEGMTVGSNRIRRTFQVRYRGNTVQLTERNSRRVLAKIRSWSFKILNQYPIGLSTFLSFFWNNTHPISWSLVSVPRVYCSFYVGRHNSGGEMGFSCKVRIVASASSFSF